MTTATISGIDFQVVPKVSRDTAVEATDVVLNFSVKVSEPGCYLIDVELFHNVSTSPFSDPLIATSQRALALPCQCFDRDTERKFQITGSTPGIPPPALAPETPPRGGSDAAAQPGQGSSGVRLLPPLKGTWPEDDTRWGNTLDVYATIDVISCQQGECSGKHPCLWLSTRKLGKPVGTGKTDQKTVELINGRGHEKAEEFGVGVVKGAAGAVLKMRSSIPMLHEDVRSIARRLDRIETQIGLKAENP